MAGRRTRLIVVRKRIARSRRKRSATAGRKAATYAVFQKRCFDYRQRTVHSLGHGRFEHLVGSAGGDGQPAENGQHVAPLGRMAVQPGGKNGGSAGQRIASLSL